MIFRRGRACPAQYRAVPPYAPPVIALALILVIGLVGCSLNAGDDLSSSEKTAGAIKNENSTFEAQYYATLTAVFGNMDNVTMDAVETSIAGATANFLTAQAQTSPQPPAAGQKKIYLVAVEANNGDIGPIGCGDYLIAVTRGELPPTTTDKQIAYALTDLFSIKDQYYGQSGLYNALYQSNLVVDSVTVDDTGHATINLTGSHLLGGVCDNPRFQAQIEYTARQFPGVTSVSALINGTPLENLLSGQ